MTDHDGHTMINGKPLHEAGLASKPYLVMEKDGPVWYETCYCRICGVQISRPVDRAQAHEIRPVGSG